MTTEQPEMPDMEEIHCRGALTLEQFYRIREQAGGQRRIGLQFLLLILLVLFTGATAYDLYNLNLSSNADLAAAAFAISGFFLLCALKDAYRSRQNLKAMAAAQRGWFVQVDVTICDKGYSFTEYLEKGEHSGLVTWSYFSKYRLIDSFLILDCGYSYGYSVFAKNWFASDDDWQRFLDLAERSIGPQQSVKT